VSATGIAGGSYAGRVITLLSAWPTVRADRADCGIGIGVGTPAGQILHFHGGSYADLRLTRPVIDRMHEVLAQSGRLFMTPGDDWIGMRLETSSDAALLVTLVSLAIKANMSAPPSTWTASPCSAARPRVAVAG
jgi:hypothetical protein